MSNWLSARIPHPALRSLRMTVSKYGGWEVRAGVGTGPYRGAGGAACLPLWGTAERGEFEIHNIADGNVSSSIGAPRRGRERFLNRRRHHNSQFSIVHSQFKKAARLGGF